MAFARFYFPVLTIFLIFWELPKKDEVCNQDFLLLVSSIFFLLPAIRHGPDPVGGLNKVVINFSDSKDLG